MSGARRVAMVGWLAACVFGCGGQPHAGTESAPAAVSARRVELVPGRELLATCSPNGPELCFNACDDNCNGLVDEGCGVPTGIVQFVIAWQEPGADVDLNVTDPNGELIEVGSSSQSGLVKDRDCPGTRNACQGQNLENVYLEEGEPPKGAYQARVRLEKIGGETPPIHVNLSARVGPRTYAVSFDLGDVGDERELKLEL